VCAADYHLRMPGNAFHEFHLIERAGPGQKVTLRADAGGRSKYIVISGFRASPLPDTISNPRFESRDVLGSWRMIASQGAFDFAARAVDEIEARPTLFDSLHKPFALTARDRLAVRCLLALLRVPGGARLLRRWHAGRTS
jgi:hypothetical protein